MDTDGETDEPPPPSPTLACSSLTLVHAYTDSTCMLAYLFRFCVHAVHAGWCHQGHRKAYVAEHGLRGGRPEEAPRRAARGRPIVREEPMRAGRDRPGDGRVRPVPRARSLLHAI
eukprot:2831700-Pleurochrysis_carterae.AAC.1